MGCQNQLNFEKPQISQLCPVCPQILPPQCVCCQQLTLRCVQRLSKHSSDFLIAASVNSVRYTLEGGVWYLSPLIFSVPKSCRRGQNTPFCRSMPKMAISSLVGPLSYLLGTMGPTLLWDAPSLTPVEFSESRHRTSNAW